MGNASEMIVRNDEDYQLKQKQTSEAHAHDLRMIKEGYEQAIKELEGDVRLTKRKRKDCISLNTTCLVGRKRKCTGRSTTRALAAQAA